MRSTQRLRLIFGLGAALYLAGCGGGQSSAPPISVSISQTSAKALDQGQSASFTATVANDAANKGVTWAVSGTGCTGAACGVLSGQTPTGVTYTAPGAVSANFSVTITATSIADSTKSSFALVNVTLPPSITTTSLPNGVAGNPYSATIQEVGGVAPYGWSVSGGNLPRGLNLNGDGSITGTPTAGGTFNFTVQVTDSGAPQLIVVSNLSITLTVVPLSISTTSLPDGALDSAYKQQVQATGGIPPYAWSVASGTIPSWASLNAATGTISGIPGATGSVNFVVKATDSETPAATATQSLSLNVATGATASESELNGHYAFLFNGFDDATESQIAIAGSFTADAKGYITAGIEDENGPSGAALNVPFTGTYNIGPDNRGAITITTANVSKTYALALNSISGGVAQKGGIVEFDDPTGTDGQRGSGTLRLQDSSSFAQAKITGPYSFGFQGQDATGKREAAAGAFTANGSGAIANGLADQNIAGTATNPSLTGSNTAPSSSNGRFTMTLNFSGASNVDFSAYEVSAHEFFAVSTDPISADGLLSGTILAQSTAAFGPNSLNGAAVYYQLGVQPNVASSQSFAEIGLLVSDGTTETTATYDAKFGSTLKTNQTFSATYAVLSSGRVSISDWYGDPTSSLRIMYLIDKNQGFFLDTSSGVGFGFVEPQSSAPTGGFSNASLSGAFAYATAAPSIPANPNGCGLATLDGSGNFTQTLNVSTPTDLFVDQITSGSYSVEANGRGTVTSLMVTSTVANASMLGMFGAVFSLLAWRRPRKQMSRRGYAAFCLVLLTVSTPAACPPISVNKLQFYTISPTRAVMIHVATADRAPAITIIEK
jgi:hypothetical protein